MLKASGVRLRKSAAFAADEIRSALLKFSLPSALLFGQPSFSKRLNVHAPYRIYHIYCIYRLYNMFRIYHIYRVHHIYCLYHIYRMYHMYHLYRNIHCYTEYTAYTADTAYTRALVEHLPKPKDRDGASQPTKTDQKKPGQSLQKNP